MNNYQEIECFIKQFVNNYGYIYSQIESSRNRKVFLTACLNILDQCEPYNRLVYYRINIEKGLRLSELQQDGWFTQHKQMNKLAYATALDVINSIGKKNGQVNSWK